MLLIYHNQPFHFEIVESVIVKHNIILKKQFPINEIYLFTICQEYTAYVNKVFPLINVINNPKDASNIYFNYLIDINLYPDPKHKIAININYPFKFQEIFFISHRVVSYFVSNKNIFFLTPLCGNNRYLECDILPKLSLTKTKVPIFCIQGCMSTKKRNYKLLSAILSKEYTQEFKIRLVGKGVLPNDLSKYKNQLEVLQNLSFEEYHKSFHDVFCIISLISHKSHPQYYSSTLTSTINYAKGYNLHCMIDEELQKIYKLKNTIIFNDDNDICNAFQNALTLFHDETRL